VRGTEFLATSALLLALGLTEASLGPRSSHLTSFLGLLVVLPVFAPAFARRTPWSLPKTLHLAAAALGIVLFYATTGATRTFVLAAALAAAARLSEEGESASAPKIFPLFTTAFGFAVFVALRDFLSLWPMLNALSQSTSAALADLLGGEARLGPTYSGLSLIVAFAITFFSWAFALRIPRRLVVAVTLLLVLALPATWLAVTLHAPWMLFGIQIRPLVTSRLFLFSLLLLPLAILLYAGRAKRPTPSRFTNRSRTWGTVAAGVSALGLFLLTFSPLFPARAENVHVLLDTRGAFDLKPLEWGVYGPEASSGASLSSLPLLLRAFGFELATSDDELTASLLDRHDVLIVVNPTHEPQGEELEAIWSFVARGGGLLVLGDHTNIQETLAPLNSLLKPSGMRFEFDSAIPFAPRWTWYSCMRTHPSPVLRGVRDESEVKTSVGASLALPWKALPLLTGRDAFSDTGDWENQRGAYLGNMSYDKGEVLGDLFLAAEVRYGKGKVIAFGDTSPFQRSTISLSHELILRTLAHLASSSPSAFPFPVRVAGALILLIGGFGMLVSADRSRTLFLFSGAAALWLLTTEQLARTPLPEESASVRIARVDVAHGNRVDLHAGAPNGIGGLVDHFFRHGDLPLVLRELDVRALDTADLLVTVAPAFPFTSDERRALRRFVDSGGLLLVASGYEEANGSRALLAEFGYSIGSTPIGAAHEAHTVFEGLSVLMNESWPVERPENRGETWVECWGYPLVVFERIGRGGLLVIGDSRFLGDSRLESAEDFVEKNIDFLRRALETARGSIEGKA
jgi:hypothetical protein